MHYLRMLILLSCLTMILSACATQSQAPRRTAAYWDYQTHPIAGYEGQLRDEHAFARDLATLERFRDFHSAGDTIGTDQMLSTGRVGTVTGGIRVIRTIPSSYFPDTNLPTAYYCEVRVLEGALAGELGWIYMLPGQAEWTSRGT